VAQGVRDDPFRRGFLGRGGADVGMEMQPDGAAERYRQILEQALGDEAQLDVTFIGRQLAADRLAVVLRLAAGMLRAVATPDRFHVLHPEVVGISPDGVNGLLNGVTHSMVHFRRESGIIPQSEKFAVKVFASIYIYLRLLDLLRLPSASILQRNA